MEKIEHHVRIDSNAEGVAMIRFERRVVDAAGIVIERTFHRTTVEPGTQLDDQMRLVTPHLVELGYEAPDAATMQRLRSEVQALHTPDRIKKFRADRGNTARALGAGDHKSVTPTPA